MTHFSNDLLIKHEFPRNKNKLDKDAIFTNNISN